MAKPQPKRQQQHDCRNSTATITPHPDHATTDPTNTTFSYLDIAGLIVGDWLVAYPEDNRNAEDPRRAPQPGTMSAPVGAGPVTKPVGGLVRLTQATRPLGGGSRVPEPSGGQSR